MVLQCIKTKLDVKVSILNILLLVNKNMYSMHWLYKFSFRKLEFLFGNFINRKFDIVV